MRPMLFCVISFITGTVFGSEYHIASSEDFSAFVTSVNSGTSFSGTTIFLDSDLSLSKIIGPVGNSSKKSFLGSFDGQGHVISDLEVNDPSSPYVGLFGHSSGTIIQNVVIDQSCLINGSYSSGQKAYVGGIIGFCSASQNKCSIMNCVNMANVIFSAGNSELNLGGIVGYLSSSSEFDCVVKNCANYGPVTLQGRVTSFPCIGGIVGDLSESKTNYINIDNCLNYGPITTSGTPGTLYIGGVVGYSKYTYIKNCVSAGKLSSTSDDYHIGSLVGYVGDYTNINYCYFTNDINTTNLYDTSESPTNVDSSLINNLNSKITTDNGWNKWLLNSNNRTITFKVNNKGFSLSSHIILLPDLEKNGNKVFSGWFDDVGCTNKYELGEISSKTTLYGYYGDGSVVCYDSYSDIDSSSDKSNSNINTNSNSNSNSNNYKSSSDSNTNSNSNSDKSNSKGSSDNKNANSNSNDNSVISPDENKGDSKVGLAVGIAVPLFVILVAIVIICIFFIKKKNETQNDKEKPTDNKSTINNNDVNKEEKNVELEDERININENNNKVITITGDNNSNGAQLQNENVNTRFTEMTDNEAEGSNGVISGRSNLSNIYPHNYARPSMREALQKAGLTEDHINLICERCEEIAHDAAEQGKLFDGFTEEDAAALAMYTYELGKQNYESNPYRIINKSLAEISRDTAGIQKARGLLYLVMTALRKLPRVTGKDLHRGLKGEVNIDKNHYFEGNIITWSALTSTSPDMKVTRSFLAKESVSGNAMGTLFIIKNGWGYDIQPYSAFPGETEILIEPERQFEITDVIKSDLIIIKLTMLDTPLAVPEIFGGGNN